MTFTGHKVGDAAQALQQQVIALKQLGYAVVKPGDTLSSGGYAVSVDSGLVDESDTLVVGSASDEVLFDGDIAILSSPAPVQINSVSDSSNGEEQYRYDTIWVDKNGDVNKTEGAVQKLTQREKQNGLKRFERFVGAIPQPDTFPSVVLAVVVVNSSDDRTSITTDNLQDLRADAESKTNTNTTNQTTLKELLNLEPASEPTTPSGGEVAVWNDTNEIKAKFSDGTIATIAQE